MIFTHTSLHRYLAMVLTTFLTLGILLVLPNLTQATVGYSVVTNITETESGQELTVSYVSPEDVFSAKDKLVVWNNEEHRAQATLSVKKTASGSVTVRIWSPSTYTIYYQRVNQKGVYETESDLVTVSLPDTSRYSLEIDDTYYHTGDTISVNFSAPEFAHIAKDRIVLYDINLKKNVVGQDVGNKLEGTKVFKTPKSSLYEFRYLMKNVALTPIKSTNVFTAELPPESDFILEAAPLSVAIREEIGVTFTLPPYVHNKKDVIKMHNAKTNAVVASKQAGAEYLGSLNFTTPTPGSYYFTYTLATLDKVQVARSNEIEVTLPDPNDFTITVEPMSVVPGEPITATFDLPRTSYSSKDTLKLVNSTTNVVISTKQIGVNPTGSHTFVIPQPGTYELRYVLTIPTPTRLKTITSIVGQGTQPTNPGTDQQAPTPGQSPPSEDDTPSTPPAKVILTNEQAKTLSLPALVTIENAVDAEMTIQALTIDFANETISLDPEGTAYNETMHVDFETIGTLINSDGAILTMNDYVSNEYLRVYAIFDLFKIILDDALNGYEGSLELSDAFLREIDSFLKEHAQIIVSNQFTVTGYPHSEEQNPIDASLLYSNEMYTLGDSQNVALLQIDEPKLPSLPIKRTPIEDAELFVYTDMNKTPQKITVSSSPITFDDTDVYPIDIQNPLPGTPVLTTNGDIAGMISYITTEDSQEIYLLPSTEILKVLSDQEIVSTLGAYQTEVLQSFSSISTKNCEIARTSLSSAASKTSDSFNVTSLLEPYRTEVQSIETRGECVSSWWDSLFGWITGIGKGVWFTLIGIIVVLVMISIIRSKLSDLARQRQNEFGGSDDPFKKPSAQSTLDPISNPPQSTPPPQLATPPIKTTTPLSTASQATPPTSPATAPQNVATPVTATAPPENLPGTGAPPTQSLSKNTPPQTTSNPTPSGTQPAKSLSDILATSGATPPEQNQPATQTTQNPAPPVGQSSQPQATFAPQQTPPSGQPPIKGA